MKKYYYLILSLIIPVITLYSTNAQAETIGDRLRLLSRDGMAFGNFLMLIIGLAGVILLFVGIWGLKKYSENPQQNPLSKSLIMIFAGAIMAGFTAFQFMLAETFTGDRDRNTRTGEFNARDI